MRTKQSHLLQLLWRNVQKLWAWSWGVWSVCRGEVRESILRYRAVPQKTCTEGRKCWGQTWTFSLLCSAASDVKWSVFLQCKTTSSTKTSCSKSGSFLAFIRTKEAEQTQWLVVQEMQRPSAERCSRKAEGLIEPKPEKQPQKMVYIKVLGYQIRFISISWTKRKPSCLTWPLLPNSTNIYSLEETILVRKPFCHNPPSPKAQTRGLWAIFLTPVTFWTAAICSTCPTALQVHVGETELDLAETNCTSGVKPTRPEEAQPSW